MNRDLESDREVEHFAEPHTPAFSRLPHHTTDRRTPKFNIAPTNRAKSDQEEAIQRALEKREQENTPFDDLALEFGIPKTALCNRFQGMPSRQKAHENHQVLTLAWGMRFFNELVNWMLEDFLLDWIYSRQWRQG